MISLIYENNKPIGWKLEPKNEKEQEIAAVIRDLQFFGFNETNVEYAGLELIDPKVGKKLGNIKKLSWKQKKYNT